jgi:hypothetical protein
MPILALLIVLAAPGPLEGAWLEIDREPGRTIAIDEAATTRDGDLLRVRIRAELTPPVAGIGWTTGELAFDCRTESVRALSVRSYDAGGALLSASGAEALAAGPPPAPRARELASLRAACHRTGWDETGEE